MSWDPRDHSQVSPGAAGAMGVGTRAERPAAESPRSRCGASGAQGCLQTQRCGNQAKHQGKTCRSDLSGYRSSLLYCKFHSRHLASIIILQKGCNESQMKSVVLRSKVEKTGTSETSGVWGPPVGRTCHAGIPTFSPLSDSDLRGAAFYLYTNAKCFSGQRLHKRSNASATNTVYLSNHKEDGEISQTP